jgi:hypothetical protein
MGFAGEWLAYQWLVQRHGARFTPTAWISRNRRFLFSDDEGDDTRGFDFRIVTTETEWLYEVKASLDESCEFELTQNEISVASTAEKDTVRRYRILYVPFVFDPTHWKVLMLPNPMGQTSRDRFRTVGRGSLRLRFAVGEASATRVKETPEEDHDHTKTLPE